MGKGDYLKHSIEDINKALMHKKYSYISGEYINNKSKIVIENEEGYKGLCRIGGLMEGKDTKFFFSKNPYTIENIKLWLIKNNSPYKLISKEYINSYEKMKVLCPIHGIFYTNWNSLFSGRGCPKCANNIKYTINEVKIKIREINPNIEILSNDYLGVYNKLQCKCLLDGHIWEANFHNLFTNKTGCPECSRRNFVGVNNPRYNPNLSEEERENGRNIPGYEEWRNKVYKRDNFTCRCCGSSKSGTLNAHHLDGYHWCKDKRIDVDNGVTLCESCHKKFHSTYGNENNTKEQFEDFLKINN